MKKKVMVLPGDGIGQEVTAQAVKVLRVVAPQVGVELELDEGIIGGTSINRHGTPLTDETFLRAKDADAILYGAHGGYEWDNLDFYKKPRWGLARLRTELEMYANLRHSRIFDSMVDSSNLKPEVVRNTDFLIVRELNGDIYFGKPRGIRVENGERVGVNTMIYTEKEIVRILRRGFEIARMRRSKLVSVEKGNVLEVGRLWRDITGELAKDYPDVEVSSMNIDNAVGQLIKNPRQFDVIVAGNMYGDILSDGAGMVVGSIGMVPSASIGDQHALYEPIHGSAPDIAGRDIANPIAAILSVAMMFRYSFGKPEGDKRIQSACDHVLSSYRTPDIMAEGKVQVGCVRMGDLVAEELGR